MENHVKLDETVSQSSKTTESGLFKPPADLEDADYDDEEQRETESNPDGSTESETDEEQDDESEADESEADESEADESEADESEADEFANIDEAEGRVANPSKDIKGDLKRILERDNSGFKGKFSHSQSYDNAPNPTLDIAELGIIPLPLFESMAKGIISGCTRVSFGNAERTNADANARATWEMNASKVKFQNPGWERWINSVILPAACNELGVSVAASKPRAEFYKLFIYEAGSYFPFHHDTENTPGMFGTMIILLPSHFSGGSLHLSYADNNKTIDASAQSFYATHVAAWYTDVYHYVDCITSGYRLALSYNLIHTSVPSLKPSLATGNMELHELRHVLLSWKQVFDSEGPDRIVYLLDHLYTPADLHSFSLKRKDARRVASLRSAVEGLGFRVCLGTIELHESGDVKTMESYDDEPEMIVDNYTLDMKDVFALDGRKVTLRGPEDLELDEDEFIPYKLSETEPDDQDADIMKLGYEYGGTMEIWYRRSGLLIWPLNRYESITEEFDCVLYARGTLGNVKSTKPTVEEEDIVEDLIEHLRGNKDDRNEALELTLAAAVHWRSATIWINACKAAKVDYDSTIYNAMLIKRDMKVLGFKKIKSFLAHFVERNRSDAERLELLRCVEEYGYEEENRNMRRWARTQRQFVLRSLRSLEIIVIQDLIPAIQRQGELFLVNIVLPQVKKIKPSQEFITEFVNQLKANNLAPTSLLEGIMTFGISNAELSSRRATSQPQKRTYADAMGGQRVTGSTAKKRKSFNPPINVIELSD